MIGPVMSSPSFFSVILRTIFREASVMKTRMMVPALAAIIVESAFAQVDSVHTKLDTLVSRQKEILAMQEKLYAEVYSEPLAGKQVGLEFNPAFFLLEG